MVVYLGDVPQSVQQGLGVSFHQLHVSLIITALLLKDETSKMKQRQLDEEDQ